jgi:hypothetical protein
MVVWFTVLYDWNFTSPHMDLFLHIDVLSTRTKITPGQNTDILHISAGICRTGPLLGQTL